MPPNGPGVLALLPGPVVVAGAQHGARLGVGTDIFGYLIRRLDLRVTAPAGEEMPQPDLLPARDQHLGQVGHLAEREPPLTRSRSARKYAAPSIRRAPIVIQALAASTEAASAAAVRDTASARRSPSARPGAAAERGCRRQAAHWSRPSPSQTSARLPPRRRRHPPRPANPYHAPRPVHSEREPPPQAADGHAVINTSPGGYTPTRRPPRHDYPTDHPTSHEPTTLRTTVTIPNESPRAAGAGSTLQDRLMAPFALTLAAPAVLLTASAHRVSVATGGPVSAGFPAIGPHGPCTRGWERRGLVAGATGRRGDTPG